MSPKKIWGKATWTLFHTMAEQVADVPIFVRSVLQYIIRICHNLPCPDCTQHAELFWRNVNVSQISTKDALRNIVFAFHNAVNARVRAAPFRAEMLLNTYGQLTLSRVFLEFAGAYNTRGSPKLLADDFHRTRLIDEMRAWLLKNYTSFQKLAPYVAPTINTPISTKTIVNDASVDKIPSTKDASTMTDAVTIVDENEILKSDPCEITQSSTDASISD